MASAAKITAPPPEQMSTPEQTLPRTTPKQRTGPAVWAWLAILPALALFVYLWIGWPWLSRWGATGEEAQKSLPGDELIPSPALVTTKAVTVKAPPAAIYPWLLQLGVDRGGMYSYLWVENWLLRLNVQNTQEIQPEWQNLQPGDFIRFTPPGYAQTPGPGFYVIALEANRALVACFGLEGTPPDCARSGTWQFVLEPQADGTRLLLRSRSAAPLSAVGFSGGKDSVWARAAGKFAALFPFYMERKMLLTLKERAEASVGHP